MDNVNNGHGIQKVFIELSYKTFTELSYVCQRQMSFLTTGFV